MEQQTTHAAAQTNYDSDMPSTELDKLTLDKSLFQKGLIRLLICSAIGLLVFFGSVNIGGESEVIFSVLYNGFVDIMGNFAYWVVALIISGNFCLHLYYRYFSKKTHTSSLAGVYDKDNIVHTVLYGLGAFYTILYALFVTVPGFEGIELITGASTGGSVIPPIVLGVLGVILVGAVFMPFLLNYGIMEIVGALLEPLMRPVFKVPGKSALNAATSFVSSSSMGVLLTNRLWKMGVYTEKEVVAIVTGFSAVSIGFAYMVVDTAGVGAYFLQIYVISFIMVFLMAPILVRIPPISRKSDLYYNGRPQTDADRKEGTRYSLRTLPIGCSRAVKRAAIAKGVIPDIRTSLSDSVIVIPQVLGMLSAIGVSAMILAEYTPVFTWLGYLFQPLISLLQIPDAGIIAASMPIGIAEMFLPVLLIQGKLAILTVEARIFVCLVSIVQIIFFSETATVMLATKCPIKFWEIVVCFLERTLLGMVLAAGAVHLFF